MKLREKLKEKWRYRKVPYKECYGFFDFYEKNRGTLFIDTIDTIIQIVVSVIVSVGTLYYLHKWLVISVVINATTIGTNIERKQNTQNLANEIWKQW